MFWIHLHYYLLEQGEKVSMEKFKTIQSGLLVGRGKKSRISRDFQGQIRGKNGRFRGNFAGIFEASFAEKRLVKNG